MKTKDGTPAAAATWSGLIVEPNGRLRFISRSGQSSRPEISTNAINNSRPISYLHTIIHILCITIPVSRRRHILNRSTCGPKIVGPQELSRELSDESLSCTATRIADTKGDAILAVNGRVSPRLSDGLQGRGSVGRCKEVPEPTPTDGAMLFPRATQRLTAANGQSRQRDRQ